MVFMTIIIIIVLIILNKYNNHRHNNVNHHPDNIYLGLHSYFPNLSQSLPCADIDILLLWRSQVGSGLLFYLKCFLEKLSTISYGIFFLLKIFNSGYQSCRLMLLVMTGLGKIFGIVASGQLVAPLAHGPVFSNVQLNKQKQIIYCAFASSINLFFIFGDFTV